MGFSLGFRVEDLFVLCGVECLVFRGKVQGQYIPSRVWGVGIPD